MKQKIFTALFIITLSTPTQIIPSQLTPALVWAGIKQTGKVLLIDNLSYLYRLLTQQVTRPDTFIEPDDQLNYDECSWVESHNSYTTPGNGYLHKLQSVSILKQLKEYGVRSLDLRVWIDTNQNDKQKKLILSHNKPTHSYQKIIKPFSRNFPTLYETLKQVKTFLNDPKNKDAIVTITLGSTDISVYYTILANYILQDLGIAKKILSPQKDWSITKNSGWPQLQYLRKKGKQIILFANKETYYTFSSNNHIESNYWGIKGKQHPLYSIGYDIQEGKKYNANYALKGIWDTTGDKRNKVNGPLHQELKKYQKYTINFIGTDSVHLGNATKIANDFNQQKLHHSITQKNNNIVIILEEN